VVCGLFVIFFIIACRAFPKFPAALVSVGITTQLAIYLGWPIHRVGEIPPLSFNLFWPQFNFNEWISLFQLAIPLGILAAVESLLSAQAADRLSGDKHNSNLELVGQGLANLATGLFGGMPVSGVVVRSTVNIQSGAKNRLAALFHAGFLLASALLIGGILAKVPIAALAGLLCIIGFRLIEFTSFIHILKTSKVDAIAFLAAAIGTLTGHIAIGLTLGLGLIALKEILTKKPKKSIYEKVDRTDKLDKIETEKKTILVDSMVYKILDHGEKWLQHLKAQSQISPTAFVHKNASIIGRIILGHNVHVAAEASIRADEGTPFYIGDGTNIQDGVVIHALKKKWIKVHDENWAVYIGKEVSLAHQALVHGPCYIGNKTFVGFKAVVHDSIIESDCYIGIGAIVVGVHIPEGRYIPHGAMIDTEEKVKQLQKVSASHREFNEDVVEVNKGLAEAYRELEIQKV
jgi:SulP family sulfate permease